MTGAARSLALALALGAAVTAAAGCRSAPPTSRPALLHREAAGPFVLETDIEDPKIRAEARETLERATRVLMELYDSTPEGPLTIRLYSSEANRWSSEGGDPAAREFELRPAHASRATLRASVACPRIEVVARRDALPDLLLCDSTRIGLAHEAAHLWTFATIPGEERIPESIHEGIAEWVAERSESLREWSTETGSASSGFDVFESFSIQGFSWRKAVSFGAGPEAPFREGADDMAPIPRMSRPFLRESLAEYRLARDQKRLPTYWDWLATPPRDARSPQLWTIMGWAQAESLLREPRYLYAFRAWLRAMAGGETPASSYVRCIGLSGQPAAFDEYVERIQASIPRWWTMGRDVSELPGTSELAGGFLLAPNLGKAVWLFDRIPRNCGEFEIAAAVEILGGNAPELWVGFGFDDGRNGVRAVIPLSGKATVEAVVDGVPNYGPSADLFAGSVSRRGPFHVRVRRRGDEVIFDVGPTPVAVRIPAGVDAKKGRLGVGARGGAFTLRNLRIDEAPVASAR